MKKLFPLLFITILFSQTKEVIVDRYENGVKKSIIVYEGEGSSEKLIRKLGFYRNGKLQFSTDWKDGKKNGNVASTARQQFNYSRPIEGIKNLWRGSGYLCRQENRCPGTQEVDLARRGRQPVRRRGVCQRTTDS